MVNPKVAEFERGPAIGSRRNPYSSGVSVEAKVRLARSSRPQSSRSSSAIAVSARSPAPTPRRRRGGLALRAVARGRCSRPARGSTSSSAAAPGVEYVRAWPRSEALKTVMQHIVLTRRTFDSRFVNSYRIVPSQAGPHPMRSTNGWRRDGDGRLSTQPTRCVCGARTGLSPRAPFASVRCTDGLRDFQRLSVSRSSLPFASRLPGSRLSYY
jgi:hypothetical protein